MGLAILWLEQERCRPVSVVSAGCTDATAEPQLISFPLTGAGDINPLATLLELSELDINDRVPDAHRPGTDCGIDCVTEPQLPPAERSSHGPSFLRDLTALPSSYV